MPWPEEDIQLAFRLNNMKLLLEQGSRGTLSHYSHFQIVNWCRRLVKNHGQGRQYSDLVHLADEVVVRWELHLATHFTINQLESFNPADMLLPKNYFLNWLRKAKQLHEN